MSQETTVELEVVRGDRVPVSPFSVYMGSVFGEAKREAISGLHAAGVDAPGYEDGEIVYLTPEESIQEELRLATA